MTYVRMTFIIAGLNINTQFIYMFFGVIIIVCCCCPVLVSKKMKKRFNVAFSYQKMKEIPIVAFSKRKKYFGISRTGSTDL